MTNFVTSAVVVKSSSVSTNQVVIGSNAKEFSEITKGDRSIGLKAEVTVVVGRSQVTAFTENKKTQKLWSKNIRHNWPDRNSFHSITNPGKKMLSTTTKSCMRTSRSAFWLKLPTVWVMPSWMAPLRADDVVYKSEMRKTVRTPFPFHTLHWGNPMAVLSNQVQNLQWKFNCHVATIKNHHPAHPLLTFL